MFIVNSMGLLKLLDKTGWVMHIWHPYWLPHVTANTHLPIVFHVHHCDSIVCLIVFLRMAWLPSCVPVSVVILMLYHFYSQVGPRWTWRTRWATNSNLTALSVCTPDTTSWKVSWKVLRIHSCGVNFSTSVQTSVVVCHPQDWICVPGP